MLLADRAPETHNPMEKRFNWRLCALASAVALLAGLANFQAQALGLGRITVQSALGEPLRAEIDIADINAGEASSLKASVASADVFKAAGMEYSPSVTDLQISLQKRADGRSYLRLSSTRAVTEPFVDLILEASWSSGRIVRDYTMLFDPPNLRQAGSASAATVVTAPVLPRPLMPATPVAPSAASSANTGAYPTRPQPAQPAVRPAPAAKVQAAKQEVKVTPAEPKAAAASGQQLVVKPGDTASKIAAQVKPASISLDQMLVALLRSNPDAFIGGNINRLKSGSVLDIPGADVAGAVLASDASTTIVAQSKNFSDFRRKLAENIPATQVGSANREAGGKVQAKVDDKAPVATTPDKLTLSKGAVKGQAAAEDKIAKDRQAKDAAERVAELSKNIGDLNKLSGLPGAAGGALTAATGSAATASPTASSAKGAGVAVVKPDALPITPNPASAPTSSSAVVAATTPASAVKPVASAPAVAAATLPASAALAAAVTAQPAVNTTSTMAAVGAASAPGVSASAPASAVAQVALAPESAAASAAVAAKKPAVAVLAPPPEPSLLDELTENSFVLPGLVGLLLLLAGFGFYRYRQRNNTAQVDSSFLESRLQPDSFFGASGGQRIDTNNEGGATGSSLVYSPSQLDAAGDVDPVAEADVYLAYGRDLQAEEILKEALRTTPNRVAIYAKLMEIYAKRRDIKAFEVIALQAFKLTNGEGPEWAYIGEMGRVLDPSNELYQPGGLPTSDADPAVGKAPGNATATAAAFSADTMPMMTQPQHMPAAAATDFDLDLDFSLDDEPTSVAPAQPVKPAQSGQPAQSPEPTVAFKPEPVAAFDVMNMDMDFELGMDTDTATSKPSVATPKTASVNPAGFDQKAADDALAASGLTFTNEPFTPAKSPAMPASAVMDHGMLEFDMGSLSLELDGPTTESPVSDVESSATSTEGPLETKFALAEEFRALGDTEGARALAQEVLAHAKGSLKSKAQAFLNALY